MGAQQKTIIGFVFGLDLNPIYIKSVSVVANIDKIV